MIADKQMKCCICETEIDNWMCCKNRLNIRLLVLTGMDYHNPAPLGKSGDVCCTYCNITKVLPVRIEQTRKITMGRKILVNINKQISLLNNNEINSVIQMIKNRRTELSMAAGSKLSVGQKVQFNGRYGMTIKGRLTKINQKTAIVSESNSPKQWKVSISLLEAA